MDFDILTEARIVDGWVEARVSCVVYAAPVPMSDTERQLSAVPKPPWHCYQCSVWILEMAAALSSLSLSWKVSWENSRHQCKQEEPK